MEEKEGISLYVWLDGEIMGENNLLRNGKCGKCSTLMMMDQM
jgi:hypothetical protein